MNSCLAFLLMQKCDSSFYRVPPWNQRPMTETVVSGATST